MKRSLVLCCICLWAGCSQTRYLGNSLAGYEQSEKANLSIEQAIDKATPYLDESFRIMSENREFISGGDSDPWIHVIEEGRYYLITKGNYPYKYFDPYIKAAVKVNKYTGEVIPPSRSKKIK